MKSGKEVRDEIDDYEDTIFAMLGFVNFYRFDDQAGQQRDDVVVFQGRRLTPSPAKSTSVDGNPVESVTPDFGILSQECTGVLGEVKKSFTPDQTLWLSTFRQLMAYDDDLTGWPTADGKLRTHDVVLLTHQSRAVAVCDYHQRRTESGEVSFVRPFSIVAFNRSDERQPYFFFEKRLGNLSHNVLDGRLHQGVQVPMNRLVESYSTIKLCDSKPPLPYMASLIWEHVVAARASDDPKFPKLRRNWKVEVVLTIDEIVSELRRDFSFQVLCPDETERQPMVPRKQWCVRACEALVTGKLASWAERDSREKVRFQFKKLDNVLEHMIGLCANDAEDTGNQLELFSPQPSVTSTS
ncbi:MAG: hypothetical protein HY318_06490 [Armatimonadetes bacterium]|nr:hypothetical protein [Armatimonadota bacterium]